MLSPIIYTNRSAEPQSGELAIMQTDGGPQTVRLPQSDVGTTGAIGIANVGGNPVTVSARGASTFAGEVSFEVAAGEAFVFVPDLRGGWVAVSRVGESVSTAKIYRVLLTQSGTDAPTAIVLENSLVGTPVLARSSAGIYTVTLAGAFTADKTFPRPWLGNSNNNSVSNMQVDRTSADVITITTRLGNIVAGTNATSDGLLTNTPLEILVYP